VVSDFELVTMMIKHSRPEFTCQHGGVVGSPDVVGQRFGLQSASCFIVVIAIIILVVAVIIFTKTHSVFTARCT